MFNAFLGTFRAYFMLPYAQQQQQHYAPQQAASVQIQHHQHPVLPQPQLPTPTPTVFSYSHAQASPPHHPSYQSLKSLEYNIGSTISPLQTSVDYKSVGSLPIVPKKTLPSIHQTSFQQFYSPGLEYHYSEAMPITKLAPQASYSYQQAPTHSYHTNYVSQAPAYSYYQSGPSALTSSYNKHQSNGLLESYVPSHVPYRQQHQQPHYKSYYPTHPVPQQQQLFTPAQSSNYAPYPSPQAYNTIQYSVPMPAYEHSKRSTSKATASLSVKAPKSN